MAKIESSAQLQKGALAPDFTLSGVDRNAPSLKDFSDKEGLFVPVLL